MVGTGLNKKSICYIENIIGFIHNRIVNISKNIKVYNYVDKLSFEYTKNLALISNFFKFYQYKLYSLLHGLFSWFVLC